MTLEEAIAPLKPQSAWRFLENVNRFLPPDYCSENITDRAILKSAIEPSVDFTQ